MLNLVVPAAFQNVQCADDVAVDIGVWVLDRLADAFLCGEVYYFFETLSLE